MCRFRPAQRSTMACLSGKLLPFVFDTSGVRKFVPAMFSDDLLVKRTMYKKINTVKSIKLTLLFLAMTCITLSCKKGDDDGGGDDCENENTTKVVLTNTGNISMRVVVANSLTPQFEAIDPVLSIDIPANSSVTKVIEANEYFILWYRDCADECTQTTYYFKTYAQCMEYEEKHGMEE